MPFKSPTSIVAANGSVLLSNRVIKCDSNLILVRNPYSELHLLDDTNIAEYTMTMTDENKKPHECQTDIKKNYAQLISCVAALIYLPRSLNSRIFLNSAGLTHWMKPILVCIPI
jgi:hypothetical protein